MGRRCRFIFIFIVIAVTITIAVAVVITFVLDTSRIKNWLSYEHLGGGNPCSGAPYILYYFYLIVGTVFLACNRPP